jgi:exonuclease SbcC
MADEVKRLQALADESANLNRQVAAISAQIESLKSRQEEWHRKDAPRLNEVEKTLMDESFLPDERRNLAVLDEELKVLGYDESAHVRARIEESGLRVVEGEFQTLEKARASVAGITRELTALEKDKVGLEEEVKSQSLVVESMRRELSFKRENLPDLGKLESDLEKLRLDENNLRGEVGRAQQVVDVMEVQRKRKTDYTMQIDALNRHIAQLKILETAFGKDGVPALLIEQALPEIEMQANELLDRLSDGRMSISFATEREFKDKKREDKRQTLDILISDATGSREYELFSGGEAFRINFAIRLALSRVLAGRAGARLQTLVIDEGFGSQDEEGRQRLIEAIRLVSRDFAKILVITHLDELKDAFDSRILVTKEDGGSRVEVIS